MECKNCSKIIDEGILAGNNFFCNRRCILEYEKRDKPIKNYLEWERVEELKKLNKSPRINWKAILGMSLTRAIARFKAAGLSKELTYNTICFEHPELTDRMKEKLQIGIAARWGEMATAQSELKRGGNYAKRTE